MLARLYQRRIFRIAAILVIIFFFIVLVLPYVIPLGSTPLTIPREDLIAQSGMFLDIEEYSIYVEDMGTSSREAVVLIHGFGGSTFSWRENNHFLIDQGYRVIAMDLKGFGLSTKDYSSDYSHLAQAEIIYAVLKELGVERACLVGHSMGTSVILHFAHLYPEMVSGLVGVDGSISVNKGSFIPGLLIKIPPFRRFGQVIMTHYFDKDRFHSMMEDAYYQKDVATQEVIDAYYNRSATGNWHDAILAITRDRNKNVIDFSLDIVDAPALIIWGEEDTWVTQEETELLRECLPEAEYYTIPLSGHLPMEEKPELFNNKMLAFLETIQLGTQ